MSERNHIASNDPVDLTGWRAELRLSGADGLLLIDLPVRETWLCGHVESGEDCVGLLLQDGDGRASVVVVQDVIPLLLAGERVDVAGAVLTLRPPAAPDAPPPDW